MPASLRWDKIAVGAKSSGHHHVRGLHHDLEEHTRVALHGLGTNEEEMMGGQIKWIGRILLLAVLLLPPTLSRAGTFQPEGTVVVEVVRQAGVDCAELFVLATKSRLLHASAPDAPTANFTASPTEGLAPLAVVFTNTSSGDYTGSLWDFGDGVTSTLENPTHTYSLPGAYTVTLTVGGLGGQDTLTRSNYITVRTLTRVYLPIVRKDFRAVFDEWTPWAFQGGAVRELEAGSSPGELWAITGDGLYRSMNYGVTWSKADVGLPWAPGLLALENSARPGSAIYTARWEGKVYVSHDAGQTWSLDVDLQQYLGFLGFADGTLYAGGFSPYRVWQRLPTGEWEVVGNELDGSVNALAVYRSTLYIGTSTGLYRLVENVWEPVIVSDYVATHEVPSTWIPPNLRPKSQFQVQENVTSLPVYSILVHDETIFIGVAGPRGLYRSSDGETWTACDVGLTGPYSVTIRKIVATKTGRLYAAAEADGVFVSENQGNRWQALDAGLPHTNTGYGVLLDGIAATALTLVQDQGGQETLAAVFNNEAVRLLTVRDNTLLHDMPPEVPPKAVLVVGPVDPPEHVATRSYIAWADRMAVIMENHGLNVVKVYWPDSTWENVRAAIGGASIVVYKGHGFGLGDLPADPTEMYGSLNGFCLVDPTDPAGARLGTQDMLITTNRLAENAVSFFFCCYCAGGSSSDPSPVSEALARRRIEAYSSTVLRMGGGGYFSVTSDESILADFFAHPDKTLGDLYKSAGGDPEHVYPHVLWPERSVWFDGNTQTGWYRAFAGDPNLTARDILGR